MAVILKMKKFGLPYNPRKEKRIAGRVTMYGALTPTPVSPSPAASRPPETIPAVREHRRS